MGNVGGKVDVLILGSGGREHALLRKITSSPHAGQLWVSPGNGGMLSEAELAHCDPNSPSSVASFASDHHIGLVVIGPEVPLVAGVADAVREAHIPCFGPNASAARIEGSKKFAKEIMQQAQVPTAAWRCFTEREACEDYIRQLGGPLVVKADGLAAGKGVIVAQTTEEALNGAEECFGGHFGSAGSTVLVEEKLMGPECSLLALTDGTTVVPLASAQDHKRAFDGDRGPNTGGMGVYSPVPFVTPEEFKTMREIEQGVVDQLRSNGISYSGCLYGGFMLTNSGPKVLEFNARFGDPETQVILPRLNGDLIEAFLACDQGTLSPDMISWKDDWALSVVLASAGYPGSYETGKEIFGIAEAEAIPGVTVYHAGTQLKDGRVFTNGGRVLDVTAVSSNFEEARRRAYAACDLISFSGKTFRHDIGLRAIKGRD
jgi:phosphoribosylamine--glycine ligase